MTSEAAASILASQGQDAPAVADSTPNQVATEQNTAQEPQNQDATAQTQDKEYSDPFPKKAVNAISRRDKTIGRLKAQLDAANAEMERFRSSPPPRQESAKEPGEPKEADYQNYHDYMRAVQRYDLEQAIAKMQGSQQSTIKEQTQAAQQQQFIAQRETEIATEAREFIAEHPEAQGMLEEHADVIDGLPPQIQTLFLDPEVNAPQAMFNLIKQGKLEDLAFMSPQRAAIEIGRAMAQPITRSQTKAPTPIPAARGSVPGGKNPAEFSPREALNFLKRKG